MAKKYYDSDMLPSGKGKHGNLPTEPVMKDFPKTSYGTDIGDMGSIKDIDSQINSDNAKVRKQKPKKGI